MDKQILFEIGKKALKEKNIQTLNSIAYDAGYTEKVDISSLGLSDKRVLYNAADCPPKEGLVFSDINDYQRFFQKGFILKKPGDHFNKYVAYGVIDQIFDFRNVSRDFKKIVNNSSGVPLDKINENLFRDLKPPQHFFMYSYSSNKDSNKELKDVFVDGTILAPGNISSSYRQVSPLVRLLFGGGLGTFSCYVLPKVGAEVVAESESYQKLIRGIVLVAPYLAGLVSLNELYHGAKPIVNNLIRKVTDGKPRSKSFFMLYRYGKKALKDMIFGDWMDRALHNI